MFDIQQFIKVKKITQIAFSENVGIDRSQLNRILNGKAELTQDHIDKIIAVYPDIVAYKVSKIDDNLTKLIDSIQQLVENNKVLVQTNAMLSTYVIPKKYTVEDMPLSLAGEPDEEYGK
jgi:transcriptional regulator with XRE-family HTH domain